MKPKEFKGTKGEWKITDEKLKIPTFDKDDMIKKPNGVSEIDVKMIKPENAYAIAYVFNHNGTAEAEANAKLIAAAPELLKQLEFNLHAFTKIIGMIPEEGEITDPGQFIHDVQNTIFARFKSTREAIEKAI